MIELALAQMSDDAACRSLLEAYAQAVPDEAVSADVTPESENAATARQRWVSRLSEVDGLESEDLSRIHGKLIALGLLEFELTGRTAGVCYRVSRRGLSLLNSGPAAAPDDGVEVAEED